MSIALRTTVGRSKRFRLLLTAILVQGWLAAAAVAAAAGTAKLFSLPLYLSALFIVVLTTLPCLYARRWQQVTELIVDQHGQITVHHPPVPATSRSRKSYTAESDGYEAVTILRDSTFWSELLILRFGSNTGRKSTLIVFPDSVPYGTFSQIAATFLWIARRNDPAQC